MNRKIRLSVIVLATFAIAGCDGIQVPDPNVIYIAFGDSSTKGPSERDYPDALQEMLGESAASFANQGRGGERSDEGVSRLQRLIDNQIYPNATVLLFWEGANDVIDFLANRDLFLLFSPSDSEYPFGDSLAVLLDDVESNVSASIRAGKEADLDVFAATYFSIREALAACPAVPFGVLLAPQAAIANEYTDLINERIRLAAATEGAVLVDVADSAGVIASDPANYFNCNHLSEQGNEFVAGLFQEAIESNR